MTLPNRPLSIQLWGHFTKISQQIVQASDDFLRTLGLTSAQFAILACLAPHMASGIRQLDLAQEMGVTPGAISQQLSKLEARGLIVRQAVRTSKYVSLSPEGKQLLDETIEGHDAHISAQFGTLSDQEMGLMLTWLLRLEK